MGIFRSADMITTALLILLGLVTLLLWIPGDIDTGMIEKFRRQVFIGDALIPTLAAGTIVICASVHLLISLLRSNTNQIEEDTLNRESLGFLLVVSMIVGASLVLMFWLGPLAVSVFDSESSYRTMRDTTPYKHLGFLVGGMVMMAGLISLIEGKISRQRIIISLISVLLLIFIFDVPFDSLLLPPNGDW
ncbi:MAG: hypothetical protein QF394_07940 [Rhodospirillales bacterium]|nr:hypothetical protein [Paracoccaceae bacterium]MDP7425334.1 hypothetical protein [Rhodospirillales bacterium]